MNTMFYQRLSFLVSVAAFAVVGSGFSAQAETIDNNSTDASTTLSVRVGQNPSRSFLESPNQIGTAPLSPESTGAATQTPSDQAEAPIVNASAIPFVEFNAPVGNTQRSLQENVPAKSNPAQLDNVTEPQQLEQPTPTQEAASSTPVPVPGTTTTSAALLTQESPVTTQSAPASETADPKVAQVDIDPGTPTRGGSSYVGVAANIGLGGDSGLGDTNFTVISKIGLINSISVRPSVVVTSDPVILIPVTYDFSFNPVDAFSAPLPFAPYVGAGVAIAAGDDTDVGPLFSAGVDFPITAQFTATAAVNVGILDDAEVGLLLGVGYNFTGLFGL